LAFVHRKPDRLRPVREQAAAKASGVLDHPMAASILPNVQAGQSSAARGFDVLLDHDFTSFSREGPGAFFRRVRRLKSSFGRRSVGRQPDQKLSRQAERKRDHQQHAQPANTCNGSGGSISHGSYRSRPRSGGSSYPAVVARSRNRLRMHGSPFPHFHRGNLRLKRVSDRKGLWVSGISDP